MSDNKLDFPSLFLDRIGKPLKQSVSLQGYSSFRIGGDADYFFEATSLQELRASIWLAREHSFPHYIIGGGNNLLFDDKGFRGLIIKNSVEGVMLGEKKGEIEVFSGAPLSDLIRFSMEEGLSGFEFLAGIPGTVGGAVFSNAGAFNQNIGNFLEKALILDEKGEQVKVERKYFRFDYRLSCLKENNDILLKAVFRLKKGKKEKIKAQIKEYLAKRERKHPPWETPCAGSYFKNPVLRNGKRTPAAFFLEKIGAKNLKVGEAAVYSGHANFIINQGRASSSDVLCLAEELKKRVKDKFGIELEEEVIFVSADYPAL